MRKTTLNNDSKARYDHPPEDMCQWKKGAKKKVQRKKFSGPRRSLGPITPKKVAPPKIKWIVADSESEDDSEDEIEDGLPKTINACIYYKIKL